VPLLRLANEFLHQIKESLTEFEKPLLTDVGELNKDLSEDFNKVDILQVKHQIPPIEWQARKLHSVIGWGGFFMTREQRDRSWNRSNHSGWLGFM